MELRRVISAWDTFESYHSQMTFEAVWIDMTNQGEKESNQGQRVPRTEPWAIPTFRDRVENRRLEKWGRAWGERAKGVMFPERGNSQLCEMLPRNQGKWGRKMNIGFGTWPTTLSSDAWLIPRRVVDFLGIGFHNWMDMGACLFVCLFWRRRKERSWYVGTWGWGRKREIGKGETGCPAFPGLALVMVSDV